jgi:hypothetical protein
LKWRDRQEKHERTERVLRADKIAAQVLALADELHSLADELREDVARAREA